MKLTNDHCHICRPFPTVVMSKKDEQLIKKDDDIEEDDGYSVAVVDNPIYDVDPDERAATVAYYKPGEEDDEDEEEMVKVKLPCIELKDIPGNSIVYLSLRTIVE